MENTLPIPQMTGLAIMGMTVTLLLLYGFLHLVYWFADFLHDRWKIPVHVTVFLCTATASFACGLFLYTLNLWTDSPQ